jgi:hypothetical protein
MAHTFRPPVITPIPPFIPGETKGQAYSLFRHYANLPRGVNVYLWSDNSVTTDYPVSIAGGTSTVKVPQPLQAPAVQPIDATNAATGGEQPPLGPTHAWNGPQPYAEVYDVLVADSYTFFQQSPSLVSLFRGGVEVYDISDAMYAILNSAGYGAYLS